MKQVAITHARNTLSALIRHAEAHGPIMLTRRGRPAAVLLSSAEYARLMTSAPISRNLPLLARRV